MENPPLPRWLGHPQGRFDTVRFRDGWLVLTSFDHGAKTMRTTKKLERNVARLEEACRDFQSAANVTDDYQTMCMHLLFELNLCSIRLNEFIAQEEDE